MSLGSDLSQIMKFLQKIGDFKKNLFNYSLTTQFWKMLNLMILYANIMNQIMLLTNVVTYASVLKKFKKSERFENYWCMHKLFRVFYVNFWARVSSFNTNFKLETIQTPKFFWKLILILLVDKIIKLVKN